MTGLTPTQSRFILHWGEMGTRWGINRTVAQVHALLYLSPRPLHAEDIVSALNVARSNVSTSLKELQSWGIVRLVHLSEDRRDHFESLKDVFEMFRLIAYERKRREIDPTLQLIRQCLSETIDNKEDKTTKERLQGMLEFFELMENLAQQATRVPTRSLLRAARMSDSLFKLLGLSSHGETDAEAHSAPSSEPAPDFRKVTSS